MPSKIHYASCIHIDWEYYKVENISYHRKIILFLLNKLLKSYKLVG